MAKKKGGKKKGAAAPKLPTMKLTAVGKAMKKSQAKRGGPAKVAVKGGGSG